jgi:hypothetical protein
MPLQPIELTDKVLGIDICHQPSSLSSEVSEKDSPIQIPIAVLPSGSPKSKCLNPSPVHQLPLLPVSEIDIPSLAQFLSVSNLNDFL